MPNSNTHQHLCAKCGRTFDCDDADDADLEMSVCPDCSNPLAARRTEPQKATKHSAAKRKAKK